MSNIEKIQNDDTYKKILSDSHGGIMYDVSNTYEASHLIALWDNATPSERENAGGIVRGAIEHCQEQY